MRTRLVGSSVVAAALILPLFASSANATTRVDGGRFGAAGVRVVTQGCFDPALSPERNPKSRFVKDSDAPLGQGAAGWVTRVPDFVTGPMVHVKRPAKLKRMQISVRRTSPSLSGQALVRYQPGDDTGVWWGSSVLPDADRRGWHRARGDGLDYRWRHYAADGQQDQFGATMPIQDFVRANGGNGNGAWVGFGFGCNEDAFNVDALTVVAGRQKKTINFEPATARATLGHGKARKLEIIAGGAASLHATLRDAKGKALSGRVLLQRAQIGKKRFVGVGRYRVGKSGRTIHVSPLGSSSYRLQYLGSRTRVRSTSKPFNVLVHTNVRAHLRSGTVVTGSAFSIAGRFWPGRRAALAVQKYVHGEWATARRVRSTREGVFQTSMKAPAIGRSYWRILVPQGGGNLAGRSPAMRLTTKAKPHSGGGGTTTPTNPDPPTNDPVQPPPPPTGPQ